MSVQRLRAHGTVTEVPRCPDLPAIGGSANEERQRVTWAPEVQMAQFGNGALPESRTPQDPHSGFADPHRPASWRNVGRVAFFRTSNGPAAHHVYFREVLCYVPRFTPPARPASLSVDSCTSSNLLTLGNLHASPNVNSPAGFSSNNVAADEGLADVPSTSRSADRPNIAVLLPGIPQTGEARYLLGPSQMGTSQIAHASAVKDQTGSWVVNYTMTKQGSLQWERVAHEVFT